MLEVNFDLFWVAQIVGFIASAIGICSGQFQNQKHMFLSDMTSNVFWSIHYALLNGWGAVFTLIVNILRMGFVVFINPRFKTPVIFGSLALLLGACLMIPDKSWFDFLPFLTACFFSVTLYFHDDFLKSRFALLLTSATWFTYGVFIGSYSEMVDSGLATLSVGIGILRHYHAHKTIGVHNAPA